MRICLAQINVTVGDLKNNQQKIIDAIDKAQSYGVDVLVFPELAICGYPPEDLLHKEHFVENNLKSLKEIASYVKDMTVVLGFVDQDQKKRIFNAAAIIRREKLRGVYHKYELPNYSVFDEKRYFTPGNKNPLFSLGNINLGVSICEDIWVDKGTCFDQSKQGAQLLINLSSSPYEEGKIKKRKELLKKRAKDCNAYIAYTNVVGGQDELVFDGGSFIIAPDGKTIAMGKQFDEDLVIADIDITPKKKSTGSVIKLGELKNSDNKVEVSTSKATLLDPLEEVYQALVLGVRDYVTKNGFGKVLIGLSGGIDSALVAAVAADALGKDNVSAISMPSQFTSSGTRNDARDLAENLDIEFKEIAIKPLFDAYMQTLDPWFGDLDFNVAEENLQARIRGNILMAFSNKFGWLVLTTGNKSEMAVGYCTLYGDMSGGFAVIKDVLKTKVYALCEWRNQQESKPIIPPTIITRAPSAELRENQVDQDSLPPYDVLDQLLVDYVENHRSFKTMAKKTDSQTVHKVLRLVDLSEYKRRQSPPGIKISSRSFDKDWRLPITNRYKEQD